MHKLIIFLDEFVLVKYYPIYIITIDILNLICKKISKLELDLTAK